MKLKFKIKNVLLCCLIACIRIVTLSNHAEAMKPSIFEMVQAEIEKRKNLNGKHSGNGTFVPVL